ncbi:MAG: trypsin-like peptidase domain-containing protein [Chloroflexota bacterium]
MTNLLEQLNNQMAATIDTVHHSLVKISDGRTGVGAGTIWQADGLIITNAHVVQRDSLTVTLPDDRTFPAKLLAYDKSRDLAALSIEANDLRPINLGDSGHLQPGAWVFAIGHPWGVSGAVTAGAVIDVGLPPELPKAVGDFIQVGLHMRPGHSGGPLVDIYGRLVGINTMITGPDVGLAIPVNDVKAFLQKALAKETKTRETAKAEYI